MLNTELKPEFDIVPHGVEKRANGYFMVFKMIVTFNEFTSGGTVNSQMWNDVTKKIDAISWGYKIESSTLNIDVTQNGYQPIEFNFDSKAPASFSFGQRTVGINAFNFWNEGTFELPTPEVKGKLLQMEESEGSNKLAADRLGNYDKILEQARNYDKKEKSTFQKAAVTGKFDFTSIYASILEDAVIAEKGFGVIRTFLIPIGPYEESGAMGIYKIRTLGEMGVSNYSLERTMIGSVFKFYNGLSSKYFDNGLFASVETLSFDPYKGNNEKTNPHPDGAYIIVVYNQTANGIEDPFDHPGITGFNAVVKLDNDFHSLSYHQTEIKLQGSGKVINYTGSGSLTPRSAILTTSGQRRNNLLFAWRGDNLLVNRKKEDEKGQKSNNSVGVETLKDNETALIRNKLFVKTDKLIPGSQTQLVFAEKPYKFFARRVSVTGHYIPLKAELSKEAAEYTLTLEDDLSLNGNEGKSQIGKDFKFEHNSLPIKEGSIIGPKKYKNANSEYVDQAQHIVLNLQNESNEKRYIYPPQIKFEDFKFLSYLTKGRLIKKANENPSRDDLIERCLELEEKIKNRPPELADRIKPIPYLADPRAQYLYFYATDFFTASKFKPKTNNVNAFRVDEFYPFFSRTSSVELIVEKKNKGASLKLITNNNKNELVWDGLRSNIYNLAIYVADNLIKPIDINKYNNISLKISVPDIPEKPVTSQKFNEQRNIKFLNYWFRELKLENATDNLKSLKYLEEGMVLKLENDNDRAQELLRSYYQDNKIDKIACFKNEYPYEIFLQKEGGFKEENGLKTSIYPNHVKFSYKVNNSGKLAGEFFSWKLNDEDLLVVSFEDTTALKLTVGNETFFGTTADVEIVFDPLINKYLVKSNIITKPVILNQYISQELSVRDIKMPDEVLKRLQQDSDYLLKVEEINSYIFIADNRNPFYQKKQVKLFSSSIFQAYYPTTSSEFKIGSLGDKPIEIDVKNNINPEVPIVKYEKLFRQSFDDKWDQNRKYSSTESLIRLTLQDDFMKEGKNMLGIILSASPDPDRTNTNVSRVGEDITKLTINDTLSNITVEDIIVNQKESELLKKYLNKEPIKYYEIEGVTYKIVEFIPFYDILLKKWQVVLSFDLNRTETMFIKLKALKIAPGYGMKVVKEGAPYGPFNPLKDFNGTNLSVISEACEFPIYNKKEMQIERTENQNDLLFRITNNTISDHKKNIFYVMLLANKIPGSVLNYTEDYDQEKFESLVLFDFFIKTPTGISKSKRQGKILQFHSLKDIAISRTVCHSILVLEFERHENAEADLSENVKFIDVNPLFSMKGIRLINSAEFNFL